MDNLREYGKIFLAVIKVVLHAFWKGLAVVGGTYSAYETVDHVMGPDKASLGFWGLFWESHPFSLRVALILLAGSLVVFLLEEALLPYIRKVEFGSSHKTCRARFVKDILSRRDGAILVGINDELSCDMDRIGEHSLHRQLLERYSTRAWIDEAFAKAKEGKEPDQKGRYPMGYSFSARTPDGRQIVFLVMSHLEAPRAPATTLKRVEQALSRLFVDQDLPALEGHRLYAPIIGTGDTGLMISKQEMAAVMARVFAHTDTVNSVRVHHLILTFRLKRLLEVNMARLISDICTFVEICPSCGK